MIVENKIRVLVTNVRLDAPGGSETFTYALVAELIRRGHGVDVFTTRRGWVAEKITRDFGVPVFTARKRLGRYDLILASHKPCVDRVRGRGFTIQTCHGTGPDSERPSRFANALVAVSEEVQRHLSDRGRVSTVIWNGVDCDRFQSRTPLRGRIGSVLSLAHSESLNRRLQCLAERRGIRFIALNKLVNPIWDVERVMNQTDLIVGVGRGAYEGLACGRPVLVLDHRPYARLSGDGLTTPQNMGELMRFNCSGRRFGRTDIEALLDEALAAYAPETSGFCRDFACRNLNIRSQLTKYLALWGNSR